MVDYEEPGYFRLMPNTGVRVLNEWLRRYDFKGLEQEEPQSTILRLVITDPRRALLRRLRLQFFEIDFSHPPTTSNRNGDQLTVEWNTNIRRQSKGQDVFVIYQTKWIWEKIPGWLRVVLGLVPTPWA